MTLQELITDLKAAGANENTMQLAMNCYKFGLEEARINAFLDEPLTEKYIYDFAGWLTTRSGVMEVGSSSLATPMADAVKEYIETFPDRFATQAPKNNNLV